jgi:hypothetical protein
MKERKVREKKKNIILKERNENYKVNEKQCERCKWKADFLSYLTAKFLK